jgi:uncharacterized membrane protein
MLMPAAVIVLLVLGAITFDFAHLYLAKRELQAAAESAANDAVTFGVDQAAVRRGDGVRLDESSVLRAVELSVAAHGNELHLVSAPQVEVEGTGEIRVELTARVDFVFAPAVPGSPHKSIVHASATAAAAG